MKRKLKLGGAIILCLPFLGWFGLRIIKDVMFNINCLGHLKRAADANTVEIAREELEIAVGFLEKENITKGYTSIIYRTPDEDVGFWYKNLKASLEELKIVNPRATQLEKSNLLMKLRETLLDSKHGNITITAPRGISVFPHNTTYFLWAIFSVILLVPSVILFFSFFADWGF